MRNVLVGILFGFCKRGILTAAATGAAVLLQSQVRGTGEATAFDVASIKIDSSRHSPGEPSILARPHGGRWIVDGYTLRDLLSAAFALHPKQIVLSLPWADTESYQIEAAFPPSTSLAQFRSMLRSLLVERFRLETHTELRPSDVLSIRLVAKSPKLRIYADGCGAGDASGLQDGYPCGTITSSVAGSNEVWLHARGITMDELAEYYDRYAFPVINDTGIRGVVDFDVKYAVPERHLGPDGRGQGGQESPVENIENAFRNQLGVDLQLDLNLAHVEKTPLLIVDKAYHPASN